MQNKSNLKGTGGVMNEVEHKHSICREIFKSIHEGRWLSIEYQNKNNQITKYWIGIRNVNPIRRTLDVDGLHLGLHTVEHLEYIFILFWRKG